VRLNTLHSLASVSPDLDLSIVATSVAPTLLIEADASEKSRSVGPAHHTWLLQSLGHVRRVPENHLLGRDSGKSQIIRTLRPCHVKNTVS
jgi:hypothetical protein